MGGFGQLFPEGGTIFPPLDLVYLGSYLVDQGMDVEILESLALELSKQALVECVGSTVGAGGGALMVLRTSLRRSIGTFELCAEIKRAAQDIAIAVSGNIVPHVRWRMEAEPALAFIVEGEPDDTVLELARGDERASILGLGYRSDGGWVHNATRPMRFDLDALPFPKWEMLPYTKYKLPASSTRGDVPYLPMLSSRGAQSAVTTVPIRSASD